MTRSINSNLHKEAALFVVKGTLLQVSLKLAIKKKLKNILLDKLIPKQQDNKKLKNK